MKPILFTLSLVLWATTLVAQNQTVTTYYQDKDGFNKVPRGSYKLETSQVDANTVKKVFSEVKSGDVLWKEQFVFENARGKHLVYKKNGKLKSSENLGFQLRYGKQQSTEAIDYNQLEVSSAEQANSEKIAQHLLKNFKWPKEGLRSKMSGRVFLQFTIDKTGQVQNLSILEGAHSSLDIQAFKILNSLTGLEPYTIDGKPIEVSRIVPINFALGVNLR